MPRPNRSEIFDPNVVSINHCVARCVRQEFLLANPSRRDWMIDRLKLLCSSFCIDAFALAFLSNHVHLILRNRPDIAKLLTDEEVARCWLTIFPGTAKKTKKKPSKKGKKKGSEKCVAVDAAVSANNGDSNDRSGQEQFPTEPSQASVKALAKDKKKIKTIRIRLSDISWLMRAFCQHVSVRANREDKKKGRFWQGRFFSQPLIDESALLACAVYIELNPVRAGLADSIEGCSHTSILARVKSLHLEKERQSHADSLQQTTQKIDETPDSFLAPVELAPDCLSDNPQISKNGRRASDRGFLSITREQFIELVASTIQIIVHSRRDGQELSTPTILENLHLTLASWTAVLDSQNQIFQRQKPVALKQILNLAS